MVIVLFSFSSISIAGLSEGGDGRRPNLLPDLLQAEGYFVAMRNK
jgi:hypothetical protein